MNEDKHCVRCREVLKGEAAEVGLLCGSCWNQWFIEEKKDG